MPTQMASRITTWGLMVEMNIPLQRESRRSQERGGRGAWSARSARMQACRPTDAGELGENLAGLTRRGAAGADRRPVAAAIGTELPLGAGSLRERQGRLRDPAGRAAPDSQGQGGPPEGTGRRRCALAEIERIVGKTCENHHHHPVVLLVAVGVGSYLLGARSRAPPRRGVRAVGLWPAATATVAARKLLYYRNPMGLPDTSPTPKKDPMGMDYVAVYEGRGAGPPIRVLANPCASAPRRSRSSACAPRPRPCGTGRTVRATGRVEPDERAHLDDLAEVRGLRRALHVNATGQPVAKGQPLFEVYSPELVSAQREYAIAVQGAQAMKDAGSESAPA